MAESQKYKDNWKVRSAGAVGQTPAASSYPAMGDATEFLIPRLVGVHFTSKSEPQWVAVLSSQKVE